MNKRKNHTTESPIAVDIDTLSAMLSCGRATARKIADEAGATIKINRRVLFNVKKVRTYIDAMSM